MCLCQCRCKQIGTHVVIANKLCYCIAIMNLSVVDAFFWGDMTDTPSTSGFIIRNELGRYITSNDSVI